MYGVCVRYSGLLWGYKEEVRAEGTSLFDDTGITENVGEAERHLSTVVSCVETWCSQDHRLRHSVANFSFLTWTRRRHQALVGMTGPLTWKRGGIRFGTL